MDEKTIKKHLPQRAPKATGKRGIKPLDPVEDFDKPVTKQTPMIVGPAQKRLPTMEDNRLADLESAAEEYAKVRDRRMGLTDQEVELKGDLHNLMRKYDKKTYKRDGILIEVVAKEETVRVKIKKEED